MSRRALLVANDSYRDPALNGLISPETDAVELAEVLRDPQIGGFAIDDDDVLVNESKTTVEQAVERLFAEARPDDLVLLYFSGHGVRSRRRQLHFAVPKTDVAGLRWSSISASFVKECMADSDAESIVVLLDCCYSGLFAEDGLKAAPDPGIGRELEDLASGRGVFILTATDAVQEALDGTVDASGSTGQSVFTSTVVQGLRTGRADIGGDGLISPADLWEYVRQEMPTDLQTPTQLGRLEEPIYLARVRSGAPRLHLETGSQLCLGSLTGALETTADHGLRATAWEGSGHLIVPLGQVVARGERGETMPVSLSSMGGHLLAVGRMGSGKSTLLRTLACSLALTHSPHELELEFLESGANKLGSLRGLPHVRGVVGDDEPDAAMAVLERTQETIKRRKRLFREHGLVSAEHFRSRRTALPGGPHPDLVVFIDQWSDFTGAIPKFATKVEELANVGRDFGVHLAVATRRPDDLAQRLRELFASYVELRLTDPEHSLIDPDLARRLPESEPGWALAGRTRFRVSQPFLSDDSTGDQPFTDGASEIVELVSQGWAQAQPTAFTPEPDAERTAADEDEPEPEQIDPLDATVGLGEILGFEVAAFDPAVHWREKRIKDYLKVPIGHGEDGSAVHIDFKEAAVGGMGPHGLLIGATGSGKSEVLRTMVASLAATHSSEELNFVLVDFKGGATFAPLDDLPHVSAVITNLADEIELVDRMQDALEGELVRRQEVLRRNGNFTNRGEYERARAAGAPLKPMPTLMIIADEFSEMLVAKPEFIDLFLQIGRLGRSLGVHMLLASQRLEEGKLRGLDTFLSYRVALRTFSAQESRTVIGSAAAYELPRQPGHGYLQVGTQGLVRFRAAYSSGAVADRNESQPPPGNELDLLVSRSIGMGRPARQVWLPPLAEPPTLDQLLSPLRIDPVQGLTPTTRFPLNGKINAVLGEEDRPFEQRRSPFIVDLSGAQGNVAVAGGPQSGKSTMLRTLIGSLALTHTPREVQFYCLDFGGGTLRGIEDLPHVAGVFSRQEPEGVRRTVQEVTAVLDERESFFAARQIDSMATYRRMKADGRFAEDPYGDVFLVIDNWMTLREDYEPFAEQIRAIGNRGLAFGVHVIVTTTRWGDIRMNMRDMFGLKLELKLSDSTESEIDRRAAANVPPNRPGRGLSPSKLHFLSGVPRIDGIRDGDDLAPGVEDFVKRVKQAWRGVPCPPVRLLPRELKTVDLLQAVDRSKPGIPIGLNEVDLKPVHLDFNREPHLLVLGDSGCGKTNLLRYIARQVQATYTSEEAKIIMADYRRGMLEEISKPTLLDYAMSGKQFENSCRNLKGPIEKRMPSDAVSPARLRDRSWWTGPDLYLIVDDYEMVAQRNNPMTMLSDLVPHGVDIGFHVIIARRCSGAARSMMDPVMGQIKQFENPGLLMSGTREEGPIFGRLRPSPQPPGRGTLVRRKDGEQLIQTPLLPSNGSA